MKFQISKYLPAAFIAFVFIQSLFYKFSDAPETIYIFSTLGEWSGLDFFGAYGAYIIGTAELIASILLFSRWHGLGALLATGLMSGAVFFHLFTPLGIRMPAYDAAGRVIGDDGGLLFGMACLILLCAIYLTLKDLQSEQGILHRLVKRSHS
ncbi:hypothetical protein [Vibrio mangrovi]|uniref:DoxX n=1 Tax=Vibrio mangrovi TaxID=474394 RepID=A0A1Y6ITP1_9VIBR|nr:hypothetical protein [Vibrio mangrovi]MDW6004756.1 hypothetical protein [Vibrio mangrovi]SMS01047.1 hypothetical protein VIM7927_02324 [Vibrio mangrovi]